MQAQNKEAIWEVNSAVKATLGAGQSHVLAAANAKEAQFVADAYKKSPLPGHSIKRVTMVYNPQLESSFGAEMDLLERRHGKPAFSAEWRQEGGAAGQWRVKTHQVLEQMAASHADPDHPHVNLLPMWHVTRPEAFAGICETGFANLALVDPGYFGKGIYSAGEAKYSCTVYGEELLKKQQKTPYVLIMNWVATHNAYPVIDGDMKRLNGKANVENYDAHFVPVNPLDPTNPREVNFFPWKMGSNYTYTELVVFNPRQCLPRCVVELQDDAAPLGAGLQANLNAAAFAQAAQAAAVAQAQVQAVAPADPIWSVNPATKAALGAGQSHMLAPASAKETALVTEAYLKAPVPGHSIKRVTMVYNPELESSFASEIALLQRRHGKPVFAAKWKQEGGATGQWRAKTHQVLEGMAAPYTDPHHPDVHLLPMWNATSVDTFQDMCEIGSASLATEKGEFLGKGMYTAGEARYAYSVQGEALLQQGQGLPFVLMMHWVATYSAYPVIDVDMPKLAGRGPLGNYDAHFALVHPENPNNPNEVKFPPCSVGNAYTYTKLAVFSAPQCLPRCVVELQDDAALLVASAQANLNAAALAQAVQPQAAMPQPQAAAQVPQAVPQPPQAAPKPQAAPQPPKAAGAAGFFGLPPAPVNQQNRQNQDKKKKQKTVLYYYCGSKN